MRNAVEKAERAMANLFADGSFCFFSAVFLIAFACFSVCGYRTLAAQYSTLRGTLSLREKRSGTRLAKYASQGPAFFKYPERVLYCAASCLLAKQ
ncbi:MAG: hypothetical protein IJ567_09170 [Lachnospiraceae bacterium]|nr:hypothetical protein [Lachnospiraceae bacterium]